MKASEGEQRGIDSLYRISNLVSGTEDPKEALRLIMDEIVRVLEPSGVSICLLNRDTQRLELEVAHGIPEDWENLVLKLGQGITGWVALHGIAKVVHDVREEPRYIAVRPNIRSEIAVPMEDGGTVIGVVVVDSERVNAFDASALKILSLLTAEASRVVSRLWLIRQLRTKASQLQSLVNLGGRITGQMDLGRILQRLATQGRQTLDCHSCGVFWLSDDGETLEARALTGRSGWIESGGSVAVVDSVMGSSIRRRKISEVENISHAEESDFIKVVQREGLVSMLATPLIYDDEVKGVIAAFTDEPHRFNNDERKVFGTLAALGAIVCQNASLYARIFETEDSMRQNEKLTTLGMLAAEIAHEIRNPLTVIKLLFDSLNLRFEPEDERERDVVLIGEKLSQLEDIVERVLGFGRTREGLSGNYDLNQLTEETLRLVRLKLEQMRIEVEFTPSSQALLIAVNKGQIQQVILNLILNAVAVMPDGGRICILAESAGSEAVFRIEDNGPGMPEAAQANIFESFLTHRAEGTGLGLSISKQIMRAHRGDIHLERSSPEGTVFSFKLPMS
ncbi:MAG: GAF domain-containing protein [Verrucomicrobia bacterium]|nr:GAF domain-containing protein [Verrucomicrobiota bacterium]